MKNNSRYNFILCVLVGNILEWYSFNIFINLMPWLMQNAFGHVCFNNSPLIAFILFVATFVLRPIGGLFFSYYADRYSRIDSLIASIFLMVIPTTLMACLPLSPSLIKYSLIALIFFRFLQGLTAGGEFPISIVYAVEQAPTPFRGFFATLPIVGAILGLLLSRIVFELINSHLSFAAELSYGWRLALLLNIPLGVWGYFIRKNVKESQTFLHYQEKNRPLTNPVFSSIQLDYRTIIQTCLASALIFTAIHSMVFNMHNYIMEIFHHEPPVKLNAINYVLGFMLLLCPLFGLLSDLIGRKIIYTIGCLGLILTAGPIFILVTDYGLWHSMVAEILLSLFIACLCGSMPALLAESFPTAIRSSALAISLNLSAALFGALGPYASVWFSELFGSFIGAAAYIILIAIISLLSILNLPEPPKRSLLAGHS